MLEKKDKIGILEPFLKKFQSRILVFAIFFDSFPLFGYYMI